MYKHFLLFITLLSHSFSHSQSLHDKVWVQGAGVSFTTTFTGSGTVNAYLDTFYSPYFAHGNSNICDQNGNLILISNGYNIYDHQANLLDNGDSIAPKGIMTKYGFSPYCQSSIILPLPFNQYYVVTPTASDSNLIMDWSGTSFDAHFDLLLYNKVDMNANAGFGQVVIKSKPILKNVRLSKTNLMACRHGDGVNWWLLKQARDTNMVYKFLFCKDSIYNYGVQGFPEPHFGKWDYLGQAMFNQQGDKYAVCIWGGGEQSLTNPPQITPGKFFVADFDRCNGELSNPRVYATKPASMHNIYDTTEMDNYTHGLCFSPNGRFLYVSSYSNIKQLDLLDPDTSTQWSLIHGIDTVWDYFNGYANMYLGPDNKLYIGHRNGLAFGMSVIENPDVKGPACNFCELCLRFPHPGATTPPCMPNYHLGSAPVGGNCWPLENEESITQKSPLNIYPNPAHDRIHVTLPGKQGKTIVFRLVDVLGREVLKTRLTVQAYPIEVDVSGMTPGVYLYTVTGSEGVEGSGKVVIE